MISAGAEKKNNISFIRQLIWNGKFKKCKICVFVRFPGQVKFRYPVEKCLSLETYQCCIIGCAQTRRKIGIGFLQTWEKFFDVFLQRISRLQNLSRAVDHACNS